MNRCWKYACVLALALNGGLMGTPWVFGQPADSDEPPPPDRPVIVDDSPAPPETGRPDEPRRPGSRFGKMHAGDSARGIRGPRGPERPPHDRKPLTDEQVTELMAMLKQVNPLFADRLEKTRQVSPDRFRDTLQRMAPRLMEMIEEKRDDPDLFKLKITDRRQSFRLYYLSHKLREARNKPNNNQAVSHLTDQLRQLLQDNFETRQKIMEYEVKKLAERIEKIRQEIKARQADRDQLIENRLKELTSGKRRHRW